MWPLTKTHKRVSYQGAFTTLLIAMVLMGFMVKPTPAQTSTPKRGEAAAKTDEDLQTVYDNFLHFARLGRFDAADAYATSLLRHPDLTPLKLLEAADRDPRSVETLTTLIGTSVGPNATKVLEVIQQGEYEKRQDIERIRATIEGLGGAPQAEFNALKHLEDSGEYAIPWMIQALGDPNRVALHPRIIRALPKIGKGAVNPLVAALAAPDQAVRRIVIESLGLLGYRQAIPYLSQAVQASDASQETRDACATAIERILQSRGRSPMGSIAGQFVELGEQYYQEETSVRADSRLQSANVWYWDPQKGFLEHVAVPADIFGPVMAMDCCEEALMADAAQGDALSLWLAANIRREARLGLDVESGNPAEKGELGDPSRPAGFPRALYFSQTAGAQYAHQVLARAMRDEDDDVALGAIAALGGVAGASSLMSDERDQPSLARALSFPDALVRIRAALVLAEARPRSPFHGADLVIPTLAEAVERTRGQGGLVAVDPSLENMQRFLTAFRTEGVALVGAAEFQEAMRRARASMPRVSLFILSAEMQDLRITEAVRQLRQESAYAATPILVLTAPQNEKAVEALLAGDRRVDRIDAAADPAMLKTKALEMMQSSTAVVNDETLAKALALQAAIALLHVADDGRTVFDARLAESALIAALDGAGDEKLRVTCAEALARIASPSAQESLASSALNASNSLSLRVAIYAALAESAKRLGNLLSDSRVDALVKAATDEPDLVLRTAASQALGALNVGGHRAGEVVQKYHRW